MSSWVVGKREEGRGSKKWCVGLETEGGGNKEKKRKEIGKEKWNFGKKRDGQMGWKGTAENGRKKIKWTKERKKSGEGE